MGASHDKILAGLYFADDWATFEEGIRACAGDLVSIEVLLQEADKDRPFAALKYLRELSQNREAPLGPYAHLAK